MTSQENVLNCYSSGGLAYLPAPDYTRPVFQVPERTRTRIRDKVGLLYGEERLEETWEELERIMKVFYAHKPPELIEWERSFDPKERFSERDMILITYGDLIRSNHGKPLQTLARVARQFGTGVISCIHVLPFFPYSTDRGFSILDFETVDPNLGTWDDIAELGREFRLMFDGVINHVSSKSRWFQEFLDGNPSYSDAFIKISDTESIPEHAMELILRPRTSELFTPFQTIEGPVKVWTTFSSDQVDLNYKNPNVLTRMIGVLLFYVRKGASIVRLDAVTYLWDQLGTSCANLPQTHAIVKIFRDVLDAVAPSVALITETNVPHRENIEYFGDGTDEAQMVYNFALPPLVLHTFYTEDCTELSRWAATLEKISDTATFLNFLDSHDGIGLMGVKDILPPEAIDGIATRIVKHGGFISYRRNRDGKESPYELNSTWFSALNDPHAGEDITLQVRRFVASRSVALVLRGVPAAYLHGALGSLNDRETALVTRNNRSINRHHIDEEKISSDYGDPSSRWSMIRELQRPLVLARRNSKAFHPNGDQRVLDVSEKVFALMRISPDRKGRVLCLTNVTNSFQKVAIPHAALGENWSQWQDLVSGDRYSAESQELQVQLEAYQVLWLARL